MSRGIFLFSYAVVCGRGLCMRRRILPNEQDTRVHVFHVHGKGRFMTGERAFTGRSGRITRDVFVVAVAS